MDPKQTPPSVGNSGNADVSGAQPAATPTTPAPSISSDSASLSATGRSVFANPNNRFRDTNPQGDILLPSSAPASKSTGAKKPLGKGLIIGIVVIALLVITAVVLLLVLPKGNSNRSNNKNNVSVSALDSYAEYFIYGTEGENEVIAESFDIDPEDYALRIESQNANSEIGGEYYEILADKSIALDNAEQTQLLQAYWLSSQALSTSWFLDIYSYGAAEEAYSQIDSAADTDSDWASEFGTIMSERLDSELARYQVLSDNNCIEDGNITDNCLESDNENIRNNLYSDEAQYNELSSLNFTLYYLLVDSLEANYLGDGEDA